MLRDCVIDFGGHYNNFLPLCEFSYDNIYHSSIDMDLFKAFYGIKCISPIGLLEGGDMKSLFPDIVKEAKKKVSSFKASCW